MKLKITLTLLTIAIIAFACYVTKPIDETWISDHGEISGAEISTIYDHNEDKFIEFADLSIENTDLFLNAYDRRNTNLMHRLNKRGKMISDSASLYFNLNR